MLLRPFELGDATDLARACRDPEIVRWTFMPERPTVDQAREWIRRAEDARAAGRTLRLAITHGARGTFLGQAGLGHFERSDQVGEIFYWVAAPARGRGVATRATRLLAAWAFDALGLERIEIVVDPENEASQRVASAAGFTREGVLRSYQRFKDRRMDAVMYSLLPDDLGDGDP